MHHFPVGRRNEHAFHGLNARLMNRLPITAEEESVFLQEMIRCDQLVHFIEEHQRRPERE